MSIRRNLTTSTDHTTGRRRLGKSKSFELSSPDPISVHRDIPSKSFRTSTSSKVICDVLGGLSLLNRSNSMRCTSGIRFLDSSTHRSLESFRHSIRSNCHSTASSDTCSFGDDDDDTTTDSESDDSSFLSSDDDDSSSCTQDANEVINTGKEAKTNGFVLSLDEIKSMREGHVVTEVGFSPVKKSKMLSIDCMSSVHPKETYKQIIMEEVGNFTQKSYLTVRKDFFVKGDEKTHTLELMTAVRQGDITTIRKVAKKGYNLQCCNKFNETIVHTAARRGQYDVLEYLTRKAGVSLRVCCDTGRTPLHDAAWSTTPNFRSVTLLLQDCPDFLGLSDSRQYTPLDYVPRSAYSAWNQFLMENRTLLIPKGLPSN
jgi:Ankyrin repeats (3 copies)